MKEKIWSVFIVCLLVVSLAPATVFADEHYDAAGNLIDDSDTEREDEIKEEEMRIEEKTRLKDDELRMETRTRDAAGNEIRVKTRLETDVPEYREEVRERMETTREEVKERVEIARERVEIARLSVAQARERFENAKEKYQETRDTIRDARAELRACQSDNGSERCVEARAKVNTQAKPFLENSADVVLEALQKVAARIEESSMPEEEKERRLAELDARMQTVIEARAQAEALGEEDDSEQVREAAAKIREAWKESEKTMKKNNGLAVHKKLEATKEQLEKLEERFGSALGKLEERGADVNVAQELYVQFQAQLDNASEILANARAEYESDTESNYSDLVKNANQAMREAHGLLQDARQTLRELLQEIKALNGDMSEDESEEETEVEVNATAESETEVEA